MTDDIEQRLDAWGRDDQPAVDGAFANRLDSQLRDLNLSSASQHRPIWQPALIAVAALIIVAGGLFALTRSSRTDDVVVMGASSQTEIQLPDGSVVGASEGLALPDGTRILVGPDGSAVVADVVLEPGTEAMINNGQLEILADQPPPDSVPQTTTTDGRPSTTTPNTRGTTSSTDRASSTTSTTSPRSTTTADTTPSSTGSAPSTDVPVSTSAPDPVVELDWVERSGQLVLSWTYVGPDALAGWEVTVIGGDRSRTLALLRDPAARSITIERLDAAVTYRVTARDAAGTIIAESNSVMVP